MAHLLKLQINFWVPSLGRHPSIIPHMRVRSAYELRVEDLLDFKFFSIFIAAEQYKRVAF